MSDNDFGHFFEDLRTVAQTPVLLEPADLRRTGTHRTKVRRTAVAVGLTLVVVAGGVTGYASGIWGAPAGGHLNPPIGDSTSDHGSTGPSTTPSIGPSSSPSAAPDTSSTSRLPPRLAGGDCRPNDLDPRPYYGAEGAMGTAYSWIAVQNVSPTACRLYGHPTVFSTDPVSGKTGTVPLTRELDATPVLLPPGGWAKVVFAHASGNPFGDDNAPECAHPQSNTKISLLIGDELAYPVPGFELSWQCGDARVRPWQPYSYAELMHDSANGIHRP